VVWGGQSRLGDRAHPAGNRAPRSALPARWMARQGGNYLVPLTEYATANWLTTGRPVLDYANAMVSSEQTSASMLEDGWREHIEGKAGIPPIAPSKLTGSLYVATRGSVSAECTDFTKSLQRATDEFVKTVRPHGAGKSKGMLGYMFWAAGCPGSRSACTAPPEYL
jgi:hypothetical protein